MLRPSVPGCGSSHCQRSTPHRTLNVRPRIVRDFMRWTGFPRGLPYSSLCLQVLAVITALFAVTPVVVLPLAALALLFPALFAGPLRALRRWWVFFNVCTVSTALYTARFTFLGVKRRLSQSDAWWASPLAFWLA